MRLEDIGFYTLSDYRAAHASETSDLQRCELILTHRCNFHCAYCRGIIDGLCGDLTLDHAKSVVDMWCAHNLRNIRFSGGEPTLWGDLLELVRYTKGHKSIQHIAISTNGSADKKLYLALYDAGVNDFSISLDACCASTADQMAGCDARFQTIIDNIETLSRITYCTVGVVIDGRNVKEVNDIISFALSLGVSDIRIIPSSQWNRSLKIDAQHALPILSYRIENIRNGRSFRGIGHGDTHRCSLVLDDMVVLGGYHFPCIIYMRERGNPIGSIIGKDIREIRAERDAWMRGHDTHCDHICSTQCLDVCVDYNNKAGNL